MREGWTETTIGDVAEASWGNTTVTKKQYKESGFTAFSASGPDGFVDWFEHDEKGVVLSAIGALCGKTWLAEGKWTPIKNTIWFKSKSKECLTDYLFLVSKTPDLWPIRGQAQPFISLGDVRLVELSMPPLIEQKRIVDVVSSVDVYIDALQQQAVTARAARNAVLHELLSAGGEDWTETTLGKTLEIARGGSPRPIRDFITTADDGIKWIKIGDATASSKYIYHTEQKIRPEGATRSRVVQSGDFILSNSMSFGRPYIMRTDGCIHDGWLLFSKVEKHFDEDFLYNLLMSDLVQKQFDSLAAGSGVRNLNIEVVKEVIIPLPPMSTQKRIAQIANSMDDVILSTEQAVVESKNLRSGLLSDLLSGEHEIPASYDSLLGAA